MLRLQVASRRGGFSLEVSLALEERATLVLVGESGAGKTTLLRMLAGLDHPDRGRIAFGDRVWFDDDAGVAECAAQRAIGYVSQDYALFPHLSVFDNVAFGLRALGHRGAGVRSRVGDMLERLAIADLATRRPHQISGGQQQRAALARALVLEPRLLLLDEPLSALDPATRREIRSELRRLLADRPATTVYVTHSPAEAMAFGERIAVLESGRVTQQGSRDDLLRHPRSRYVAEFLGLNLFRGSLLRRAAGEVAFVTVPGGELAIVDPGETGDAARVTVVVSPREITLSLAPPSGSARNVFRGAIEELVPEPPAGEQVRVLLATDPPLAAEVTRRSVEALGLRPGVTVYASFKATGVVTLP